MDLFCIIIITYNSKEHVGECLRGLKGEEEKVVVIDNASVDGTVLFIKKNFPGIKLVRNKSNLGFAKTVNQGLKIALQDKQVKFVLLLNPDTYNFKKDFIKKLIKTANQDKKVGITAPALCHYVGEKLFYGMEGKLDLSLGKASHKNIRIIRSKKPKSVDFVSGACMLIKREVLNKAGLFDENYFLYLEDVDYCLEVRKAGFKIILDPAIVISHKVSASLSSPLKKIPYSFNSNLRLISKWTKVQDQPKAYLYIFLFYPYLYILWTLRIVKRSLLGQKV